MDGLFCDFTATRDLMDNGLVRAAWSAPPGTTAPAVLTHTGVETLALLVTAQLAASATSARTFTQQEPNSRNDRFLRHSEFR